MTAMRIALYSHVFPPRIGGSGVQAKLLAEGFAARGHAVTLITSIPSGVEETNCPFRLVRRPTFGKLLAVLAQSDLLLEIGPCMKAGFLARAMRKPLVIAHPMFPATGVRGLATRALCAGVPNIAPAEALARALRTPAMVIPNPYDDSVFRKRVAAGDRGQDVVFVGRLIKEKGLRTLLLALDLLRQRGLRLGLTVVGCGPDAEALQAMSRDLGLDGQVALLGAASPDQLAEIYNTHRIAVVPSLCEEGFGLVALEAIACGCVVVGAISGGLPEAIGPCGVTYPRTSIRDLASRLEQLVLEPRLLDVMQGYAKEHLAWHTRTAVAGRYLRFMADCFPALASAAHSVPNHVAGDRDLSGPVQVSARRTIGRRTTAKLLRADG